MFELTKLRHAFPEPAIYIDRPHGYPDYTFLHFFQSVTIEYRGEKIRTKPHAMLIYDIGAPQFFANDTPILHDWIHFKGDLAPLLQEAGLTLGTIYYPAENEFITTLVREMETEFYSATKESPRLCSIKLEELLLKLGRSIRSKEEPYINSATAKKLRRLRSTMFSHPDEHWPVERMAAEVGFSPSRFYSLYKSFYKVSPTNDLINARIARAENLLLCTDRRIGEIAAALGYDNTTHFIRQFRRRTGLSPTAYRKTK